MPPIVSIPPRRLLLPCRAPLRGRESSSASIHRTNAALSFNGSSGIPRCTRPPSPAGRASRPTPAGTPTSARERISHRYCPRPRHEPTISVGRAQSCCHVVLGGRAALERQPTVKNHEEPFERLSHNMVGRRPGSTDGAEEARYAQPSHPSRRVTAILNRLLQAATRSKCPCRCPSRSLSATHHPAQGARQRRCLRVPAGPGPPRVEVLCGRVGDPIVTLCLKGAGLLLEGIQCAELPASGGFADGFHATLGLCKLLFGSGNTSGRTRAIVKHLSQKLNVPGLRWRWGICPAPPRTRQERKSGFLSCFDHQYLSLSSWHYGLFRPDRWSLRLQDPRLRSLDQLCE